MSRKITVLVEKTQSKVVLDASNANTLGELKNELMKKGVQFNPDDSFKESRTKSILASDESPLPSNIPWKGGVTNDLVFMISAPYKKIESGLDRKALYKEVNELGIAEVIKKEVGRNYTQVGNEILAAYVQKYKNNNTADLGVVDPIDAVEYYLLKLRNSGRLSEYAYEDIMDILHEETEKDSYDELAKEFNW